MPTMTLQFDKCLKELEERAKPSKNDIRNKHIVDYINCFISKFGNERVYLVGSTGERSKLAYFKDDGDADFLLVSGKLVIPVENLEFNIHTPCYVRILADESCRCLGLEIADNNYLSAYSVRGLKPELFTFLRAVYSQVTATTDRLPENDKDVTLLSVSSKVGLQLTRYRSLQFDDATAKYIDEHRKRLSQSSHDVRDLDKNDLARRWSDVKVHKQDIKIYRRIFKVLKLAVQYNENKNYNGGIAFFTQLVEEVLRQQTSKTGVEIIYCRKNLEERKSDKEHKENFSSQRVLEQQNADIETKTGLRATYKEKSYKDFVPALLIEGELECMKKWKKRVEEKDWPSSKVNEIYSTHIFVVAKAAPIDSKDEVDFCLSFNLAEQKLTRWMSPVKRQVFLILKAFLKGVFGRIHKLKGIEMKLTTYHVKTVLFWLYEDSKYDKIDDESTENVLENALLSLHEKLREEELLHYFVHSNLFADFQTYDFKTLILCVDEVKKDPVHSLQYYIDLKDGKPEELLLTQEEFKCLLNMSVDGGRSKNISLLQDAMVDFQRGLNDSQRDRDGNTPFKDAVIATLKLYFTNEGHSDNKLFKLINDYLSKGETDLSKLDKHEAHAKILDTLHLIEKLVPFYPRLKHFLDKFGGKKGLTDTLMGAFYGKPVDFTSDLSEQIAESLDRYLSCLDEEEDFLACEVRYKIAGYFLGRVEFPDLSLLRTV